MGDTSTLDAGYKPIPLYAGRKCRASVHVVQVLAPLADGGVVVVDDLEASALAPPERPLRHRRATRSSTLLQYTVSGLYLTPVARTTPRRVSGVCYDLRLQKPLYVKWFFHYFYYLRIM